MPTARGPLMLLALGVVLCACATPSPTATPPAASPVVGSPTAPVRTEAPVQSPTEGSHASPVPSASVAGILGVLPGTVNGATAAQITLSPSGRTTPKVFLKVLGRLGGTPPEMTLGLAFAPGGTAYAMRVAGVTGDQILRAFLEERTGLPPEQALPGADRRGEAGHPSRTAPRNVPVRRRRHVLLHRDLEQSRTPARSSSSCRRSAPGCWAAEKRGAGDPRESR